ncbi:MAG: hypothetical protein ACT443_12620 [Gemmatimonadota bacterium]
MQGIRRFMLVAAVALTGACAPATEQAASDPGARRRAMLEVENNNWSDVTIYLVRGSMRTRVGSVVALGKAQFNIPAAYVVGTLDITLAADPIGSNDSYVSPPIQVFPGARLALTVGNQLRLSNFAVYAAY